MKMYLIWIYDEFNNIYNQFYVDDSIQSPSHASSEYSCAMAVEPRDVKSSIINDAAQTLIVCLAEALCNSPPVRGERDRLPLSRYFLRFLLLNIFSQRNRTNAKRKHREQTKVIRGTSFNAPHRIALISSVCICFLLSVPTWKIKYSAASVRRWSHDINSHINQSTKRQSKQS